MRIFLVAALALALSACAQNVMWQRADGSPERDFALARTACQGEHGAAMSDVSRGCMAAGGYISQQRPPEPDLLTHAIGLGF
jgi:hypothetical protein